LRRADFFGRPGNFPRRASCAAPVARSLDSVWFVIAEDSEDGILLATSPVAIMRRHHEELVVAPSIIPALALLLPFAGALWARIKAGRGPGRESANSRTRGGDL
jgi:hypothetical protein